MTNLFSVKRALKYWWQRRTRGWDDSDVWSVDCAVAKFAIPRIRRLRQVTDCVPHGYSIEEWDWQLGEIEWYLEKVLECYWPVGTYTDPLAARLFEAEKKRFFLAEKAWQDHFQNLWW